MIDPRVDLWPNVKLSGYVNVYAFTVIGRPAHRPTGAPRINPRPTLIGAGTVIGSGVVIYEGVTIGQNVLIGDGAKIREGCIIEDDCIIGSNCTFQRDVIMHKGSRVIDLSHITNGVEIGEDAFLSTGVLTMDDDSFNSNFERSKELRPPKIGKRASIGGGAILLPGVVIGDDAVVAAGAVVTKSVEPGILVMGVPARPTMDKRTGIPSYDLSYDGIPGVPSHEQIGRKPLSFDD